MKKLIIAVSNKYEANQIQKFFKNKDVLIFALSLEAEFFLEKNIVEYKNPLYEFLGKNESHSGIKYFSRNFEIARTWYKDPSYEYIQDRLGYFLLDLERSLDFVNRVFKKYKAKKIIISKPKYFRGYFIKNTLIQNAFLIQAKTYNIRVGYINSEPHTKNLKQILGNLIKPLIKNRLRYKTGLYDVLFIVPPLKFLDLDILIKSFNLSKIKIAYLTYNLTLENKRALDKFKVQYFLKESFIKSELKNRALKDLESISNAKEWTGFRQYSYQRNEVANSFIKAKIKDMVKKELLEALIDKHIAKDLFNTVQPKILLTLTDPDPKCLPYINVAKTMGVKTISIEHGGDFDLIPYSLPKSDNYITWSPLAKKRLLDNNYTNFGMAYERKRILIGHSPFHKNERVQQRKLSKKLVVLLLTTINYFDIGLNFYYLKKLFKTLERSKLNIELLVRPHPFQDLINLRALLKKFRLDSKFVNKISLKEAVNMSDAVIFENTTAAFDALLAEKPTVFFNPYSGKDFFNLGKNKAALALTSEEHIKNIVAFLVNKQEWKTFASEGKRFALNYLGIEKNNKSMKITTIIKKLIESNKKSHP